MNTDGIEFYWFDPEGTSEDAEDQGLDSGDLLNAAHVMAKGEGVNILRNMSLSGILYDLDRDQVAGGVWTSTDLDSFSFDVAVNKEYQGKRLSHTLINAAMAEYDTQNQIYEDMNDGEQLPIQVDVINPKMAKILQSKYGFTSVQDVGQNRTIMTR